MGGRPTISPAQWLEIGRRLKFSPQQRLIAIMIREEDLGAAAIGMRLRELSPNQKAPNQMPDSRKRGTAAPLTREQESDRAKRHVETQLRRMYQKLNRPAIRGEGPEVHSRAALVDRIWVEYWRLVTQNA